ncbi:oligosaccharyltransferase complex subunit epsilon [Saitoella coloradoensis]
MAKATSAQLKKAAKADVPSSPATTSDSVQPVLSKVLPPDAAVYKTLWHSYTTKTPQKLKILDAFMAFLVVVGVLQFVYCVLVGNYPFNAFLAGFASTVGQFVLTASLRIQANPANKATFESVSPNRAFADFAFASVILHFFVVNFLG